MTIDCGETVKAWCFGGQGEQQKVEENLTSALKARSTGRSEGETFETSCMAHGCYLSAPASDLSTSTCSCEDIWGAKLGALDISPWYMLHSGSPPRKVMRTAEETLRALSLQSRDGEQEFMPHFGAGIKKIIGSKKISRSGAERLAHIN